MDYRGEIGVILLNTGDEAIRIGNGERVAQGVLSKVPQIEWETVDMIENLPSTDRGQGGFGSTGIKDQIASNSINYSGEITNEKYNKIIETVLPPAQDNTLANTAVENKTLSE